MKTTAQQWAQDWVAGMNGAAEKMKRGVQAVTVSPGIGASDAIEKMRANWIKAIDNGTWQQAVTSYSLQQWQASMINKGIPRIADGVRNSQMKVQNYAQRAIPIYQQLQAQIDQMPKRTLADSLQRVRIWMEGMESAKQQLKGA